MLGLTRLKRMAVMPSLPLEPCSSSGICNTDGPHAPLPVLPSKPRLFARAGLSLEGCECQIADASFTTSLRGPKANVDGSTDRAVAFAHDIFQLLAIEYSDHRAAVLDRSRIA